MGSKFLISESDGWAKRDSVHAIDEAGRLTVAKQTNMFTNSAGGLTVGTIAPPLLVYRRIGQGQ